MATEAPTRTLTVEYVKTIGIVNNGDNGRGFANPYSLAVSSDGRIFVLNRCDPTRAKAIRIGILNLDEEYLGEFGDGRGDGDSQFVLPVALAFDSRDRIHVTDEHNQRVTVFDSSGNFITKWGVHGSGEGEFDGPAGIAFDSQDNAYVVDQNNHRIQKYRDDGHFVLQWGEHGDGDGQLNQPWGIAVDSEDSVYVADWRNDRIQKFTSDGEFLSSFGESGGGEGQLSRPSGVAVDDQGNIYVSDWGNERVQVFGPNGEFLLSVGGEATLSKWAEEFFASNPDERVERDKSDLFPELPEQYDTPYLVSSQTEPYFWGPVSILADSENRVYVTEANRHRFQVYQRR